MKPIIFQWGTPSGRGVGLHTVTINPNGEVTIEWEHDDVGGNMNTLVRRRAVQIAKAILAAEAQRRKRR